MRAALFNAIDLGVLNSGIGLGINKAPFNLISMKTNNNINNLFEQQYYFPEELFLENLPSDPKITSGKYLSFKKIEFTCDDSCACDILSQ